MAGAATGIGGAFAFVTATRVDTATIQRDLAHLQADVARIEKSLDKLDKDLGDTQKVFNDESFRWSKGRRRSQPSSTT